VLCPVGAYPTCSCKTLRSLSSLESPILKSLYPKRVVSNSSAAYIRSQASSKDHSKDYSSTPSPSDAPRACLLWGTFRPSTNLYEILMIDSIAEYTPFSQLVSRQEGLAIEYFELLCSFQVNSMIRGMPNG
jgi:hypothetical protein